MLPFPAQGRAVRPRDPLQSKPACMSLPGAVVRTVSSMVFLLPVLVAGCAAFAVQPPTPAKYLDMRAFDQASPCERYYVITFSSEKASKQTRFTHSWATVARVTQFGADKPPAIEHHTISWMPATLEIIPLRLRAEPGVNLGLHDTIIKVAMANDE